MYSGQAWLDVLAAPPAAPSVWIQDAGQYGGAHAFDVYWANDPSAAWYSPGSGVYYQDNFGVWNWMDGPSVIIRGDPWLAAYSVSSSVTVVSAQVQLCATNDSGTTCAWAYWP